MWHITIPTSPPPALGEPRVSPEPATAHNLHDLSTRIPAQGGPRTTRESGCCLKLGKGSGHASDGKLQRVFSFSPVKTQATWLHVDKVTPHQCWNGCGKPQKETHQAKLSSLFPHAHNESQETHLPTVAIPPSKRGKPPLFNLLIYSQSR